MHFVRLWSEAHVVALSALVHPSVVNASVGAEVGLGLGAEVACRACEWPKTD